MTANPNACWATSMVRWCTTGVFSTRDASIDRVHSTGITFQTPPPKIRQCLLVHPKVCFQLGVLDCWEWAPRDVEFARPEVEFLRPRLQLRLLGFTVLVCPAQSHVDVYQLLVTRTVL